MLGICILLAYGNWFAAKEIIGGDWPYFYQEAINNFTWLPPVWSGIHGNGLGGSILSYSLDSYLYFIGWLFSGILHIPWVIVYKIFWFGLFLGAGVFSLSYLMRSIYPTMPLLYRAIGIIIYLTNTYILMLMSGGQMGIGIAYALSPLVFARFIKIVEAKKHQERLKYSIVAGLLLAVQFAFDLRVAYMLLIGVFVYSLFHFTYTLDKKSFINNSVVLLYIFILPLGVVGLLNAFWIIPALFYQTNPIQQLGSGYNSLEAVTFFSFAKFENTIGLLHPFWPENIFGKVGFMKPEFIILPIIAFSSMFFVKTRQILFFALLGLIGAFLAKGANEPFGGIYLWLFGHVSGFIMFRDPTKFYQLVVLAYSILIPFSLWKFWDFFSSSRYMIKRKNVGVVLYYLVVILFFLLLLRPAILQKLPGTFQPRTVPHEYVQLKDELTTDRNFYRVLWTPRQSKFTFASHIHPSIESEALLSATNAAELGDFLHSQKAESYLADVSVRYIVVPHDPYGEIFVDDRKYSQKKRDDVIKVLDTISWLKKRNIGKLVVYQTTNFKDHFYLDNDNKKVNYTRESSTNYTVQLINQQPTKIIFSENYSPYWEAVVDGKKIVSEQTPEKLNSFVISHPGNHTIKIYYSFEKYYIIGRVISGIGIVVILFMLLLLRKKYYAK